MIAYLDTHVLVWLAEGQTARFRSDIRGLLRSADLVLSPIVLLEIEYLYEVNRSNLTARDIQRKAEAELGVRLCSVPFSEIANAALDEKWTRDPFDRLIVANAKANGFAPLISADEKIARHYPRTMW